MVDQAIHPNVRLVSYWRATWGEEPEPLPGRAIDPTRPAGPSGRPTCCARCGEPGLTAVDATDDSGTAWRQYYFQFRCDACGAYTVFHYDD